MKIVCFILILLLMTDQAQGSSSLLWSGIHRSTKLTKDDEWIDEALSTEDMEESNAGNPDADVPAPDIPAPDTPVEEFDAGNPAADVPAPDTPDEESAADVPAADIPIEDIMSVDRQIPEPSEPQEPQETSELQEVSEEIEMSDTPASLDNQEILQEISDNQEIPQEILGIPEIQITDSERDALAITTGD